MLSFFNERIRNLNIIDIKLAQAASMCVILIVVKVVPQILQLNIWWFIILAILFGVKPLIALFLKK